MSLRRVVGNIFSSLSRIPNENGKETDEKSPFQHLVEL